MKKYIFGTVLLAVLASVIPAHAQSSSRSFDLGLGFGKTGIGKGYSVSSTFHLFPHGSISPVVRYSWTGSVDVSDDRSVIALGGTETMDGSQWMFGLKPAITLKKGKHWELELSAENGFQKTTFHYRVTVEGQTFSGIEKRTGYYFLPAASPKYWFTDRQNLAVTFGVIAHGDPTGGDWLGRTITLGNYTYRFDLPDIRRFFRKKL